MQICSNLHNQELKHQLINLLLYVATHDEVPQYVVYALQHVVFSCMHEHTREIEATFKKGGMLNVANASPVLDLPRDETS